ncbi:MAG TPA: transketolase C-terminal domain-containing protein, partial [Phycicoccus sp.]|nr:transketolase C-terminal domain-containing protein [Phycicoccus sp.]
LNRAFDQLLMDCALHKAGVTVVLDRSGVTGPDGASHHGMWDMTIGGVVPGLHLAAPRDGQQVARAVRAAVAIADAPSVVRFPKGTVADPIEAVRTVGGVDVLAEPDEGEAELLLVGVGAMAATALTAAEKLAAEGHRVRVVDPVWALPVPAALVELARSARRVAVVEDNVVVGGIGTQVEGALRDAGLEVPVDLFGLPKRFLDHGSRGQVLDAVHLTPDGVAERLRPHLG